MYHKIYKHEVLFIHQIGTNPCKQQSDQSSEPYHHPRKFHHASQNHVNNYSEVWFTSYSQFTPSPI